MTSQPEDKFAVLVGDYKKVYESSFGAPPPRGGENSPSNDPENRGMKRLEEGRVDSRDMKEEDESRRGSGEAVGPGSGSGSGSDVRQEDAVGDRGGGALAGGAGGSKEGDGPARETVRPRTSSWEEAGDRQSSNATPNTTNTDLHSPRAELPDQPDLESRSGLSDSDSDSEDGGTDPDEETDDDDENAQSPSRSDSENQADSGSIITSFSDIATLIRSEGVKNIIILAGAGISTSAGIPDFRSPKTGLYANLAKFDLPHPEAIFDIGFFRRKPEPFYVLCKDLYPGKHLPTPTHYLFRLLQEKGKLLRIFTQNIDTLERIAGIPAEKIVEAHGSFASSHCIQCHAEVAEGEMRRAVEQHAGKPVRCGVCEGLVKPDIVFFGEGLPERFFERASRDLPKCDLLITIGTSLQVQPFASLVDKVPPTCPRLLINRELVGEATGWNGRGFRFTPGSRDSFYKGDADAGAVELAKELGWENELKQMIESQQGELRTRWGLDKVATEQSAETSTLPDETMDKLAKELEQAGL